MTEPEELKRWMADPDHCGGCGAPIRHDDMLTEINPPGGYGRMQLLLCDVCMRSDDMADWRNEHWPNWPNPR